MQRGLSAKSAGLHLRYRARIAPLPLSGNRIIGTQPVDKLAFLAPEIRIAGERLVRHAQLLGRPVANILRLLYDQLAHDGALIVGCENQNLALRIGDRRRIVRRRDEDSPVALVHGDLVSAVRNALDGDLRSGRRQLVTNFGRFSRPAGDLHLLHLFRIRFFEQQVELLPVARQSDPFPGLGQRQNNKVRIGNVDVAEHRIAVLTGPSVLPHSLTQLHPVVVVSVGNVPVAVLDLQLRRVSVVAFVAGGPFQRGEPFLFRTPITVFHGQFISGPAVVAVKRGQPLLERAPVAVLHGQLVGRPTVLAGIALERGEPFFFRSPIAVFHGQLIGRQTVIAAERSQPLLERTPVAVLHGQLVGRPTRRPLRHDPVAATVLQPLAVERPIVKAVRVLFHADHGSRSALSVLPVIDRNGTAPAERDRVADRLAVLHDGSHAGHVVIGLQRFDDPLQRDDIGIHPIAQPLQRGQTRAHILVLVPHGHFVVLRAGRQGHQAENQKGYYLFHHALRI